MELTSGVFGVGQPIPRKYSQEGENVSPPLSWKGAPTGAREFAIVLEDPDSTGYQPWVHWLVWGIPADKHNLAESNGSLLRQGKNSSGKTGYAGPMPPPGHGEHHYRFRIFALDTKIELKNGANKDDLFAAMEGHVLDQAELVGTYERA
jgi:Raf kinase inhibitor-like YbhB/YbcL family protein